MKILIPFRTPTINKLYWHRQNMKIMTTTAKNIRKEIDKICSQLDSEKLKNKKLKVTVDIYENWFTKDKRKSIKKVDVANREKFLIDSIFVSIGIDDKFIFEQTFRKVQSSYEKAIIIIEELKWNFVR